MSGLGVVPLALSDPLGTPGLGDRLASELATTWLVWDAHAAGARRVDLHPLVLSARRHDEACRTAERAAALVARAADRAATDPAERDRYRFHEDVEALASAARASGDTTALVRVDLLLGTDGGFVACEVNADCPGGHNEASGLTRLARTAGFRGGRAPEVAAEQLADRLVAISGGPGSPRGLVALVFATGYAEDLQVCAFVERLVVARGGRAVKVPPTALRARAAGGLEVRGERVSALYRFYPVEYMAGQRNAPAIARAVRDGEVRAVSSFAAAHAQSKLAMARAHALEPAEAAAIFPETWALADVPDPGALVGDRAAWVVKRDLSRVGDHVLVGAEMTDASLAAALAEVREAEEDGEVWIAQRFVPQRPVPTPWGPRWLTLGVYVFDGRAAGLFARLSRDLTCSHDALVVPVFVDDDGALLGSAA